MSLFTSEEEKTLSFDEYMTSFDTNQIAKVQQFIDWLGQYRGELVYNPWGEVNPDLEIVRPDFDAAQVRRRQFDGVFAAAVGTLQDLCGGGGCRIPRWALFGHCHYL